MKNKLIFLALLALLSSCATRKTTIAKEHYSTTDVCDSVANTSTQVHDTIASQIIATLLQDEQVDTDIVVVEETFDSCGVLRSKRTQHINVHKDKKSALQSEITQKYAHDSLYKKKVAVRDSSRMERSCAKATKKTNISFTPALLACAFIIILFVVIKRIR